MYTNEAREYLAERIPWVQGKKRTKGKKFNYLTFMRLRDEGFLPPLRESGRGAEAFNKEDLDRVINGLPKEKRPPNRIGIINWLKGERPKKDELKKAGGKGRGRT